nr:MAG TPA: hypothetical protein [Caudoviricetes sp.]
MLTRESGLCGVCRSTERISTDTGFPVRLWKLHFDSVRITLSVYRRSMIQLNYNIMMLKRLCLIL